jgi:hypothetical protein
MEIGYGSKGYLGGSQLRREIPPPEPVIVSSPETGEVLAPAFSETTVLTKGEINDMEVTHEYASKGVAGTGLGLGIAGTALGVLNGGLGNLVGGITGGNQNPACNPMAIIAAKDSQIAKLESERYTDAQVANLYQAKVRDDKELMVFATNIDKRVTALEVSAPLREQILQGQIAQVAQQSSCCCNAATVAISNLQASVNAITKLVVPNSSVCPGWGNVTITPATTTTSA